MQISNLKGEITFSAFLLNILPLSSSILHHQLPTWRKSLTTGQKFMKPVKPWRQRTRQQRRLELPSDVRLFVQIMLKFALSIQQYAAAYQTVLEGRHGSEKSKQLAAQLIPRFFARFPAISEESINGQLDMCEDTK